MDLEAVLRPNISALIEANLHTDTNKLALILSKQKDLPVNFIVNQISGRKKAEIKLPSWNKSNIVFPKGISMEQCTSEVVALYKSSTIEGEKIIDLTGGFGVDSYFFSKRFKSLIYVEKNEELFKIVQHNFGQLKVTNTKFHNAACESFIENFKEKVDVIYLDPSRRNKNNGRMFMLSDCEPKIIELQESLFEIAPLIILKSAPMLDIDLALKELKNVEKVEIISYKNECKEVLYFLKKDYLREPQIKCIDLIDSTRNEYTFYKSKEREIEITYTDPLCYLYDPNSSVLKGGAYKSIAQVNGLTKIAANTHLYTSTNLIEHFQGKIYKVLSVLRYNKLDLIEKYDACGTLILKNFVDSLEQSKKKLGFKEGKGKTIFCTRLKNNKPVLIVVERISGDLSF